MACYDASVGSVSQERCRYVVLAYSKSPEDAVVVSCLVVLRHESPVRLFGQIEVLRSADWDSFPKEISNYLLELADDWRRTPHGETEALIERLGFLSIGSLRACKTGQCNRAEVESAIREAGIVETWKVLG